MTVGRLKKIAFCLTLIFLLLLCGSALQAREGMGKSCLFRVTAPGSTVYLLGSIHFMRETAYPLKDTIEKAFAASSRAVFEVDMSTMDSPDTQAMMLSRSIYIDGNTLRGSLSPSLYQNLAEKTAEFGLDVTMLDAFKPWSVAMTLMGLKLDQLGFDPAKGVDRYFYARARAVGKSTSGLETLSYQIGLFDALSSREQEWLVEQTIREFDTMESEMGDMIRL